MNESKALFTHKTLDAILNSFPSSIEMGEESKEWFVLMFDAVAEKILKTFDSSSFTFSPHGFEETVKSFMSPESDILQTSVHKAKATLESFGQLPSADQSYEALSLSLPENPLRFALLETINRDDDPDAELLIDETLVFFSALLESLFIQFLKCVIENTQIGENGKRLITEAEIALGWNSKASEWATLISMKETQEEIVHVLLKVCMLQELGTVTKLLKVATNIQVKELCEKIKKKMLSPAQLNQEKRYCLFCHDFESEEAEGFFLDDEKLVGFYPTIRNDSTIELVEVERDIQVYVSENGLKTYRIEERQTVEKILKYITIDLGFREPSRFGLILLGDECETGETPVTTKLRSSKSYDVLTIKRESLMSTPTKKAKRPVSNMFVKDQGSFRNKAEKKTTSLGSPIQHGSINSLSSLTSNSPSSNLSTSPNTSTLSPNFSPNQSGRHSIQEPQTIIQTKDRSEWIKKELTLKEQGIEFGDFLLLVRQEKILSFYDKLDEDPIGVFNKLTENAENILQQLKSLSFEVDMITQSPSPTKTEATTQPDQKGHIVICTIDFDGDEGQLSFKTNDEIEVLRKEGDSWFGRLVKDGKEGYFHHLAVIDPTKKTSAPKEVKQKLSATESEILVKMEGYLFKKGRNFDHWKKKYYRLRNHCMWYYKSENDEKAVGHFSILQAKVTKLDHKKKPNTFSISVDGNEKLLSAPSQELMEQWITTINRENTK